jgi:hypothetical protein
MRARHRLAKLLLRHEIRFEGPQADRTQAHLGWLAGVQMPEAASRSALEDYRGAVGALIIRREDLEGEIARALPESPWVQTASAQRSATSAASATPAGSRAARDRPRVEGPASPPPSLGSDGAFAPSVAR